MEHDVEYPGVVPAGVQLTKNVPVTMRDGIALAVDIYRPASGSGPWPVILAYSPFQKERSFESAKPEFYCPEGYVCVQAAERGLGFNQGSFCFHGPKAAEDGYDLVEWLGEQEWCNGSVAMMGASGYGVSQWYTAPLKPPHLKALVVLGTTDNYRGLCYPGGVLRKPFVQHLITGFIEHTAWPGDVPGKEQPENIVAGILKNTTDGPFWWEHGGGWRTIGEITTPVLNVMNTPNRLHTCSQLRSYPEINAPKKLLITPWTHEQFQPWIFETTAFNRQIVRWLDHWLKGIDTGIMDEPEVAIYDNGTGDWQYESEYPIARTSWEPFHLAHRGAPGEHLLRTERPDGVEAETRLRNENLNAYLRTAYGSVAERDGGEVLPNRAVYVSEPLAADLRICGPISLTLYAATSEEITSDWTFFAKLGEMVPEGEPRNPVTGLPEAKPEMQVSDRDVPANVQLWSFGCLKVKYRQVDEALSAPGLPWHPFTKAEEVLPDTIYELQIEMTPVFKTFRQGCRLWLKIACDDVLFSTWDSSSRYVETPSAAVERVVTIHSSPEYPSQLSLPVVPASSGLAEVSAPLRDALPGGPRFTT